MKNKELEKEPVVPLTIQEAIGEAARIAKKTIPYINKLLEKDKKRGTSKGLEEWEKLLFTQQIFMYASGYNRACLDNAENEDKKHERKSRP